MVVVVPREATARVERTVPVYTSISASRTDFRQLPAARSDTSSHALVAPGEAIAQPAEIPLPKRRRGSTLAAVHPEGLGEPSAVPHVSPAPPRPSALAAFQRAVAGLDTVAGNTPTTPPPPVEN